MHQKGNTKNFSKTSKSYSLILCCNQKNKYFNFWIDKKKLINLTEKIDSEKVINSSQSSQTASTTSGGISEITMPTRPGTIIIGGTLVRIIVTQFTMFRPATVMVDITIVVWIAWCANSEHTFFWANIDMNMYISTIGDIDQHQYQPGNNPNNRLFHDFVDILLNYDNN